MQATLTSWVFVSDSSETFNSMNLVMDAFNLKAVVRNVNLQNCPVVQYPMPDIFPRLVSQHNELSLASIAGADRNGTIVRIIAHSPFLSAAVFHINNVFAADPEV